MKLSAAMERYLGSDACRRIQERFDKLYVRELPAEAKAGMREKDGEMDETKVREIMNIKMGESKISVTVEGCFRCSTSFSRGWFPHSRWCLCVSVRRLTGPLRCMCVTIASPRKRELCQRRVRVPVFRGSWQFK